LLPFQLFSICRNLQICANPKNLSICRNLQFCGEMLDLSIVFLLLGHLRKSWNSAFYNLPFYNITSFTCQNYITLSRSQV
jgi:hypothetical protein